MIVLQTVTYSSTTTISASDEVIFLNGSSGNLTITLPDLSVGAPTGGAGHQLYVKRIDTNDGNTVTIETFDNSQTIDNNDLSFGLWSGETFTLVSRSATVWELFNFGNP